jgi:hypothetical protein
MRRWCRHHRVWLNGEEVTARCQAFDSYEGWALLLLRDAQGKLIIDWHEKAVARRRVHGRVVWAEEAR